jgi:molybdopterin-guanine dinucleotide biosynthesis protein A
MGTEKALLDVEGELLVARVARRVAEAADPVMLAPGTLGRLGELGYAEVEDELADAGPLAGLVAGLAASPHELLAVVATDMPYASGALLELLAGVWCDEDAVVPANADGSQPLHALYARQALPKLRAALQRGTRAMHEAVGLLSVRIVGVDECRAADPSGRWALNVNDMHELGAILGPE